MVERTEQFIIPRDMSKLRNATRPLEGCVLLSKDIKEENKGPIIREKYTCPCGDVVLEQKSIIGEIKDTEEPTSTETVRMTSKECRL